MTKSKAQDRDRPGGDPGPAALPQGSLGAWLRAQREARGVGLREIADSSKISLRYLEALETDRFEVLPAPVFTRGFLREYARVVGLDPDEVVNLYLVVARDREPEAAVAPGGPETAAARPRGSGPSALGYGLLVLLAVAIFLGLAALFSWWSGRRGASPADDPAAAEIAAPRSAPAGAAPAPPAADVAEEVAPAPAPPAAADSAVAAPPPLRVVLEFGQDCWVEFVVDGKRRTSELRASGELLRLEAADHVLITLGNIEGVRVEVDGHPMPLPAGARVVRDLRIDRQVAARLAGAPAT
jgi:cytoskeleton protein RodZ